MIIRDKSFYRTFFGFFLILVFQNIISDAITPIFDHIHAYVPMLGNL